MLRHHGGQIAPERLSGRNHPLTVKVAVVVFRRAHPVRTVAWRPNPYRLAGTTQENRPVVASLVIKPADQGGIGGDCLLHIGEGRGPARVSLVLAIQGVLELDPLAAYHALLASELVELCVLCEGTVGLGGQPGDALVKLLEPAGQFGLAANYRDERSKLTSREVVEQAAGQPAFPPAPGIAGLALPCQADRQGSAGEMLAAADRSSPEVLDAPRIGAE